MHNRSDFGQSWRFRYLTRQTDAGYYDFSNKHGDTENQAPLRSTGRPAPNTKYQK